MPTTVKLVGGAPNQVPRNKDLGNLAYQNAESIAGPVSIGGALTLSQGTVNGVPYLNGSKILTSSSALTFDGSQMVVGGNERIYFNTYTNPTTHAGFIGRNTSTGALEFGSQTIGGGYPINFLQSGNLRYQIDSNGNSIWSIGSEQMRLTSTGLGIGTASPTYKLDIRATSNPTIRVLETTNGPDGRFLASSSDVQIGTYGGSPLSFYTNATEKMRIDTSGNLGLGVTPSAWQTTSYKVLQVNKASLISEDVTALRLNQNYYIDSAYASRYISTGFASFYIQANGSHAWSTAPSGTAGAAISFTQAMTLDASGNLLVGKTSGAHKIETVGAGLDGQGTTSVTTTATTIYTLKQSSTGALCVIFGDNGTDGFMDLIFVLANVTPQVITSKTIYGSPSARTYTQSATAVRCALASGSLFVRTSALSTLST